MHNIFAQACITPTGAMLAMLIKNHLLASESLRRGRSHTKENRSRCVRWDFRQRRMERSPGHPPFFWLL